MPSIDINHRKKAQRRRGSAALCAAACTLALASAGLAGAAGPAARVGCLIEPESIAEVGSSVIGAIESLHVERGDLVRKGQVLATLKADVERASLQIAQARSQSDAEVRAAQSNLEFLRQKQGRTQDLVNKNFLSQQVLEQARAEADIAEQKLTQASEQRRVLKRELDLAQAQLEVRNIRAPIDGVIAERYVQTGERIDQKQMFRIARIDPLKVELIVPASLFGTITTGSQTQVTPNVPGIGVRDAKVTLVDRMIDAGSNTFRVRASLPNPGGAIPAGARCTSALAGPATRGDEAGKDGAARLRPATLDAPARNAAPRTEAPRTEAARSEPAPNIDRGRISLEPQRRAALQ